MITQAKAERFAMAHGYDSYAALREASVPLPGDTSANWFVAGGEWVVAVDDEGRWFAWREAGSDGEGPESSPDAGAVEAVEVPLAMPARRRPVRAPEEIAPEHALAH